MGRLFDALFTSRPNITRGFCATPPVDLPKGWVPPVSAPLPRYPEHMHGNVTAQIDYDRRHPERNAAAFAARPDSRPKPKYQVTPNTYIPSAWLDDKARRLCEDVLDEHGVEAAYKVERYIIDQHFAPKPGFFARLFGAR